MIIELASLAGTSTGSSQLLNGGPGVLPTAGLVADEEKIVGQIFVPANAFRDTGEIVFECSGLNNAATASNAFTFQVYYDTKPIRVVAGLSSGVALITSTPAAVFTWTPGTTDAWRVELALTIRDMVTTTSRLQLLGKLFLSSAFSDGEAIGTKTSTVASTATANWTDATNTVTQTDAFGSYTFQAGDVYTVTAGTGATLGAYVVRGRTSKDEITVETDIAVGDLANNDIVGAITRATADNSTQTAIATSTVSGVGTFTVDNYLALVVKSSVTASGFSAHNFRAQIKGCRSQGIFNG